MNINNVNLIFNEKLQDINSRMPSTGSISGKFQELLEQTQLKNSSPSQTDSEPTESDLSSDSDVTSLLKNMLSTQSLLNSVSSSSDSSGLFPASSMNSTINMLQQTQLLNALKKNSAPTEE